MTKDLVSRVEKIESSVEALDATDREMLQALNARLAVCDLQAMRLAELRDVEVMARGTQRKAAEQHEVKLEKSEVEPEEHLPPPGERTSHDEDDVEAATLPQTARTKTQAPSTSRIVRSTRVDGHSSTKSWTWTPTP
jgi:hypothetical protein